MVASNVVGCKHSTLVTFQTEYAVPSNVPWEYFSTHTMTGGVQRKQSSYKNNYSLWNDDHMSMLIYIDQ